MWVKLTLPPWRRRRCPLRTLRLTSSSRAGTVRTEVAVGTSRLASIASTILAAAPRSGTSWGSPLPSPPDVAGAFGCGLASGSFALAGASWRVGGAASSVAWPPSASTRPSAVVSGAASSPGSFSAKKSRQAGLTDSGLSRYWR
jgi:hypothetical protein